MVLGLGKRLENSDFMLEIKMVEENQDKKSKAPIAQPSTHATVYKYITESSF